MIRPSTVMFCLFLAMVLHGCSLPTLEGGQMSIVSRGVDLPALEELAKIDIAYQLDPENKGFCHLKEGETPRSSALPVSIAASGSSGASKINHHTAEIRCALDGFYSTYYFDKLTPTEKSALEVSNVAFAYAEKQINRIGELSQQVDNVVLRFDAQSRESIRARITEFVNQQQVDDLIGRVKQASRSSAFLEFQRRKRNGVQSAFIAASDAACDVYKRKLNNIYSTSNFSFGSTATVAGGLGAAASGENTARALAALAGITSGVRAEYNDAFFRNKVVELLTKAMDISRLRKKEAVRRRSAQIMADYSMEDALGDAILYNSQCSLVAGLQETSEALQTVSDPGLKWLANAFGGAASDNKLTRELFESLGKAVGTVQSIQKSTEDQNAVVGTPPAASASAPR